MAKSRESAKIINGVVGLPVRKVNGYVEYLLTRRYAPLNPEMHGKWQLAGGEMRFGESPEQTLVRELQEEISVTPRIIFNQPVIINRLWKKPDGKLQSHLILLAYLVTIDGQEPKNTDPDDETDGIAWFTYEEITELSLLPQVLSTIQAFQTIIKTIPSEMYS